jgi:acyl carrier protein
MIFSNLLVIINAVRAHKGFTCLEALHPDMELRREIAFDSLDLAEFTVRIEEAYGVDIFADGLVATVGEVVQKIESAKR